MKLLPTLTLAVLITALPCPAVEIIAHRGYSERAPENTVSAFQLAWEKGADSCELDLYLTKDGQIVVIHDKNTKRTTGVALDVAQSTLAELRKLDAGSWKDAKWNGEKLPTLDEALATLPAGKKRFFLEIKCGPEVVPALAKNLAPWRDRANQIVIISFKLDAATAAKKAIPWAQNYLIVAGKSKDNKPRPEVAPFIEQAQKAKLDGLDLGSDWAWSPALVQQIRSAGLGVYVWTVDKPADVQRFHALGVDGITTNDPVVVRQALAGS